MFTSFFKFLRDRAGSTPLPVTEETLFTFDDPVVEDEAEVPDEEVTLPDISTPDDEKPASDSEEKTGSDAPSIFDGPFPTPTGDTVKTDLQKVDGGRVTTIDIDSDKPIAGVQITGQPAFGQASVNPDNSIALVLSGTNDSGEITLDYTVAYTDGTAESYSSDFEVARPLQDAGWGEGEHYMLEVDGNDDVSIETGDIHRDVYIGGSETALSRADIARAEGLRTSDITRAWLAEHPEYGGSEDMALDADVGMDLWYGLTGGEQKSSHWLHFERGHTYEDIGQIIFRGASGESELHPLHVTSWGEGERPVLDTFIRIFQRDSDNVVFSDVTITGGVSGLQGSRFIFDDVKFTEQQSSFQNMDQITIRNSELVHAVDQEPGGPDGNWHPHIDRAGGLYVANSEGLLLENNFIHHNGWEEGYDGTAENGAPPSAFSQNIYLQNNTTDVTFRDNISSQSSSFGAQFRGGAYVEDNVFLDNNAAFNVGGGIYRDDGPIGNFSFVTDNLVTSGAHKVARQIGGLTLGADNYGFGTTFLDNIVAHLADPNNDQEFQDKIWTHAGLNHREDPASDDTIVYNWVGSRYNESRHKNDLNVDGLDRDELNQVTIQNFAAEILGKENATISDLTDYIGSLAGTDLDDSFTTAAIIDYFQKGFGVDLSPTDTADSHRFVPDDLADGFRWDNRINWDGEVLPGQGDDIDLSGNRVLFGAQTISVGDLDLGDEGILRVTSGVLRVDGTFETGRISGQLEIDNAGQFWTQGFAGSTALTVDIAGGRFVNTGAIDGPINVTVSDNAQVILGTDADHFDLFEGGSLTIDGSDARIGFDGDTGGTAVLRLDGSSALSFISDADGISGIGEFRSGAFGDGPVVQSGINLGGGSLKLDLTDAPEAGSYVLASADELVGRLKDIDVIGLGDRQDLSIELDYGTDTISLILGQDGAGAGLTTFEIFGDQSDAQDDQGLWDALTDGHETWNDASNTTIYDDGKLIDIIG